MAYATYTTEAIVCGSYNSHTSDRSYLLFTKDGGMLFATARSVREERSKQRFALQEFSVIRVSLIKGKSGWRVGSVEAISNPFMEATSRRGRTAVAAVVKLLRRFLRGEESNQQLFEDTMLVLACLSVAAADDVIDLQDQYTLRLLHSLGYIAPHVSYQHIIDATDPWSVPETLPETAHKAIAQALTASHL